MNKKIALLIAFISLSLSASAQLKSKVDEKFELTSIAFRLAGADEYNQCRLPDYAQQIDDYFAGVKDHKLINYIKNVLRQNGIGYDAVSTTSGLLEIKNGKISLQPQYDIRDISNHDERWNKQIFAQYLSLLNQFYSKSKFSAFYRLNQDYYNQMEKRMDDFCADLGIETWVQQFFGRKMDHETIIYLSPTNGSSNYSIPSGGILIGMHLNEQRVPGPKRGTAKLISHEIGHLYTNDIVDQYFPMMESAADKIYPYVAEKLAGIAYAGTKTMIIEWLNRLFVLSHQQQNNDEWLASSLRNDMNAGFCWMERSLMFMGNFHANSTKYPTINEFMPELVEFFNFTADNFNVVLKEYADRAPYVIEAFPINGRTVVADFDHITFKFSEPMFNSAGCMPVDSVGVQYFPIDRIGEWKDDRTYVFYIDKSKLESGESYGISLIRDFFQSAKTYSMTENCNYIITIE